MHPGCMPAPICANARISVTLADLLQYSRTADRCESLHRWFHAPWLHAGANARECVHGLTNERQSKKYELTKEQVGRLLCSKMTLIDSGGCEDPMPHQAKPGPDEH